MVSDFKKRFRKLFIGYLVIFILLFVLRFIFGYVNQESNGNQSFGSDFFSSLGDLRKNYSSENFVKKGDNLHSSGPATNQKFEKTAKIKSKFVRFENDEKQVKAKTRDFNAVIQYEQNIGLKGNRQMHLLIGVNPVLFDSFYTAIQKIGDVKSLEITKVDKTNEYRQLNGQKASLEKNTFLINRIKSQDWPDF